MIGFHADHLEPFYSMSDWTVFMPSIRWSLLLIGCHGDVPFVVGTQKLEAVKLIECL